MLNIQEPGQNSGNSVSAPVVGGLDFGTQNSLIAYWDEREQVAKLIQINGKNSIRSQVSLNTKEKNKTITYSSIKRLLGRTSQEVIETLGETWENLLVHKTGPVRLPFLNKEISPEQLAADVMLKMVDSTALNLGKLAPVSYVLTVPAYFDEEQRQAIKNVAKIAGIRVIRFISEPTAAALHVLGPQDSGIYGVFDLGGGTFDFTLLQADQGAYQVLHSQGDSWVGGDDLDHLLFSGIKDQLDSTHPFSEHLNDKALYPQWLENIRKTRESMADAGDEKVVALAPVSSMVELGITESVLLSIKDLQGWMNPLYSRCMEVVDKALTQARIQPDSIKNLIAVGGVTRCPYLRSLLSQAFPQTVYTADPDTSVVLGAAQHAAAVSGQKEDQHMLLDVVPLSIGLEVANGLVETIVPRNASIPVERSIEFTNWKANQSGIVLNLVQGERALAEECIPLASLTIANLNCKKVSEARIKVTVMVDEDGLLEVKAHDLRADKVADFTIKNHKTLDAQELEAVLVDSQRSALQDGATSVEIQEVNEAITLYENAKQHGIINNPETPVEMKQYFEELFETYQNTDRMGVIKAYRQIRAYLNTQLGDLSEQKFIENNVVGKRIEDFE